MLKRQPRKSAEVRRKEQDEIIHLRTPSLSPDTSDSGSAKVVLQTP